MEYREFQFHAHSDLIIAS
uniref:Uncharacterized protein n=1 Tax=Anguilla anguilla TaxID=7936 RepID=A0A0E9SRA5_ANGAN